MTTRVPSRSLPALALAALLFSVTCVVGCSSQASTRSGAVGAGPTTTARPVVAPASIPAGTTLRVGDQLDYLKTVLGASGQDKGLHYKVSYSSFVGGPPMLQAFQGGSLDAGFIGSTPLIFAQAAKQDLVAVAGWASRRGLGGLLTSDPSIKGWGDLKGKRVAYQRGTAAEASLLQGLDTVGLKEADITTVDVPITQVNAALQGGSADAGVTSEPLISLYLANHSDARIAAVPGNITDRSSLLIASHEALADSATTAALADYTTRLVKAFAWLQKHPDALATAVFVKQYGLPEARAEQLVKAGNGTTRFFALPGAIRAPQQKLAGLFRAAGQIPASVDVAAEFDTRFNDLVAKAQAA